MRWAVTYTNPLAARWSGAPLGVPLHPVQAYAALGFLTLAVLLLVICLRAASMATPPALASWDSVSTIFVTEFWRDWEGRGSMLHGALNGPQVAALVFVLAGALLLRATARRGHRHSS